MPADKRRRRLRAARHGSDQSARRKAVRRSDLLDEFQFTGFEKRFTDGQTMIQQGGMVTQMFILSHGAASVVVRRDGEETMIGSVGEGDFFGEYALLTELASEFEVRAVGDCM